jgi:hypothetical protein
MTSPKRIAEVRDETEHILSMVLEHIIRRDELW